MKLATTTADFRGYCETPADWVRAYEGTGFKHLDYSFYKANYPGAPLMSDGDWMKEVVEAAKAAEKLGFDFVQAHSPGNDPFREDLETVIKGNVRAIEACGYLGIDNIVVHSGRTDRFTMPNDRQKYFDGIKRFYEALYSAMEKYNVRVLAENYTPTKEGICSLYSGEDLVELIEYCNHPLLGICWDVGHGNLIKPAQYDDIVTLGDKLLAVHIQDNMGIHDDHICPYMGTLDIDAVMCGLRDNGFIDRGGIFTFECDDMVSFSGRRNKSVASLAAEPTFEIKKAAVTMMYQVGKAILTKYDCFED